MSDLNRVVAKEKPLAGSCQHKWKNQESPFLIAQVCPLCKLFRYKIGLTADWEYRAPIPIGQPGVQQGG